MGFHAGLRSQLTAMGEVLNDAVRLSSWTADGRELEKEALFFANQLATDFKTFSSRIGDHAAYEDQSLFPFFTSLLPDFAAQGEALTAQHQEMEAMETDIQENLTALISALQTKTMDTVKSTCPRLLAQYSEYHQLIIEHLATEELSIIGPWLHLTTQEYTDYQEKYLAPFGHSPSSIPMVEGQDREEAQHGKGGEDSEGEKEEEEAKRRAREEAERVEREREEQQQREKEEEERARQQERERRARKEREQKQKEQQRKEPQQQQKVEPPKLYDRYGREVDLKRPGCCFDGVDGCCKGSAYQRLLQKHGYVLDPKTGNYVLRK